MRAFKLKVRTLRRGGTGAQTGACPMEAKAPVSGDFFQTLRALACPELANGTLLREIGARLWPCLEAPWHLRGLLLAPSTHAQALSTNPACRLWEGRKWCGQGL